jgi:hypothetical protein
VKKDRRGVDGRGIAVSIGPVASERRVERQRPAETLERCGSTGRTRRRGRDFGDGAVQGVQTYVEPLPLFDNSVDCKKSSAKTKPSKRIDKISRSKPARATFEGGRRADG